MSLHDAAARGLVDDARAFLDRGGADVVNAWDDDGRTPLDLACRAGHTNVATILLDRGDRGGGADVDRVNRLGVAPLYVASARGHVDAARLCP